MPLTGLSGVRRLPGVRKLQLRAGVAGRQVPGDGVRKLDVAIGISCSIDLLGSMVVGVYDLRASNIGPPGCQKNHHLCSAKMLYFATQKRWRQPARKPHG